MKRWIAGALCACMLLTMCPVVMAEETEAAEELTAEEILTEAATAETEEAQLPAETAEEETEPAAEEEIPEETLPEVLSDETIPEEEIPEETEEAAEIITEWYEFTTAGFQDDGTTTESRLMRYLRMPLTGPVDKKRSSAMFKDRLNSMEQEIYNASKAMAAEVAAGKRSSTTVVVTLDLSSKKYTAAELGVSALIENGKLCKDAMDACTALVDIDFDKIYWAVLGDCPYEMYWEGHYGTTNSFGFSSDGNKIWISDEVKMSWSVADPYSATGAVSFQADTAKTSQTASALEMVHRIVDGNASLGNREKLNAYQNAICELTDYNTPAANGGYPYYYGDPWQLIYVFDGDPTTKVVCEGYSKAFQYLCELSSFKGDVYTVCVSGNVTFSDGTGGAHMWNIVHMDDGENYHVDVTNSDGGSKSNNRYFLTVPTAGSVAEGYRVSGSLYQYDKSTRSMFTEEQLSLSMTAYSAAAAITSQPFSQTVVEEENAQFRISAVGNGLSYQWQYLAPNGTWKKCDAAFPGYNADTLTVLATADRDGYQFRCVVTDSNGKQVVSNPAVLVVNRYVRITAQPQSQSVPENGTAEFRVTAYGTGLRYQWQYCVSGGEWTNCTANTVGSQSDALSLIAALDQDGCQYRCVITDTYGKTVTSEAAVLTVLARVKITSQPTDQKVIAGGTASFTVKAVGSGLSYRWQMQTPRSSAWVDCPIFYTGSRTDTMRIPAAMNVDGYRFRCIVDDSYGNSETSEAAVLTVGMPLEILRQPVSVTVQPNGVAAFAVEAEGTDLLYQWQCKKNLGGTWENCSADTEGYNTACLKPVGIFARNGYQYRCIIQDAFGTVVVSKGAILVVSSGLKITRHPADSSAQQNTTAAFTVAANGTGLSYQWQYRIGAGGGWVNCSASTKGYNMPTLRPIGTEAHNGYQYRCRITDAYGMYVFSNPATLRVFSTLKITRQPVSANYNAGAAAVFHVEAVGSNLTYRWQYRSAAGGDWVSCTSTTAGYNTATLRPVASMLRSGYQYRCIVADGYGVAVVSAPATLTVTTTLRILSQPVSQTVQTGKMASFNVAASGLGLLYRWEYRESAKSAWAPCTSAYEGYNTPTLRPVGSAANNGVQFRCAIIDQYGNTIRTNPVLLTVK